MVANTPRMDCTTPNMSLSLRTSSPDSLKPRNRTFWKTVGDGAFADLTSSPIYVGVNTIFGSLTTAPRSQLPQARRSQSGKTLWRSTCRRPYTRQVRRGSHQRLVLALDAPALPTWVAPPLGGLSLGV